MITLPNYPILQLLYESTNSLVYRALRKIDNQPVILKLLKENNFKPAELTHYQQEYDIISSLSQVEGVIQVYSLEKSQNTLLLILEDFGGHSLTQHYSRQPLNITEFFTLAISITQVLGNIHAAHVIHKDINPSNIVFNPTTGQLKLIDFGIATRLSRENPLLNNPKQLEGTLPYLSPEQTGRMNRSLDYRTDFYALGVTFYELLTGQLPFNSQDAAELVHCHLAKRPLPPHQLNPALPPLLSEIVLKLMAKVAEERYQSAWGLKQDLEQCQRQFIQTGQIDPFLLAQHDFSDHFHLPQKLYGREDALPPLFSAFEQVTQGSSKLLLVVGYSGVGKSSLVQEIYKPMTEKRGYFITGKFDQFQRNIPYSAVVQAFRDLVQQLLTEAQLNPWKTQILTAVGSHGQVIMDVIPEIELIIGKQPEVPPLSSTESQNRFNLVFKNFIKVFCQAHHPLIIFLDDLQWIDSASLKLMTLMMNDIPYLLFIGAYRDNEVGPMHPLTIGLEIIKKMGVSVETITLLPLTLSQMNQFMTDTFNLSLPQTFPLAHLLLEKTGGNPFFMGEFLKTLYAERLIHFEVQQRCWQWDLVQIKALNITDNIVGLMISKIQRLAVATQRILTLAAAVGSPFDLTTLAVVSQQSEELVKHQLWEAQDLIVPLAKKYKFVHDCVQQAAYSLISELDLPALHWQIGQLLKTNLGEALSERLFEVVDHLNFGQTLVTTPEEKMQLIRLNLQAGQKAKLATAYRMAAEYLQHGKNWLTPAHWQTTYELTLTFHLELVEVMYLCGDFERMERIAEVVLQQAQSHLDKVKIYEVKVQAYTGQTQYLKALQTVRYALSLFGVEFPEHPMPTDLAAALAKTAWHWQGLPIHELVNLPRMSAAPQLATMRLLFISIPPSYVGKPELFPLIVSHMINLSIEYGNSEQSPFAYACYGMILCHAMAIEEGYQFGQLALQVLEQFDVQVHLAVTFQAVDGFIKPWKEHLSAPCCCLKETYPVALEEGNLEFAAYISVLHCAYSYLSGQSLAELESIQTSYLQALTSLKQENCINYLSIYQQNLLSLLQPKLEDGRWKTDLSEELTRLLGLFQQNNDYYGLFQFHTHRLLLCYLFQEPISALEHANAAKNYLASATGNFMGAVFVFYDALVQLSVYAEAHLARQEEILQQVAANQEKMKRWAQHAPMNFQHKYDLVEAETARVLSRNWEAAKLYEKAILGARAHAYLQEEALACELAAQFYLAHELHEISQTYLTKAHQCYQRWGAKTKEEQLQQKYLHMPIYALKKTDITSPSTTTTTLLASRQSTTLLDVQSLTKSSQILFGERKLSRLLDKMMSIVIENAGAQIGFLLLSEQEEWLIQAHMGQTGIEVLQALPLTESSPLATSVIQYVSRTRHSVVLDHAACQGHFTRDPHIIKQQTQSLLCIPLINQGKLSGIVYLENNLAPGMFTPDRVEVLSLLSSQLALSIENAILYTSLEQKVAERTTELAQANQEITVLNERLKAENLRMGAELEITRHLQKMVLPRPWELEQFHALDIAAFMEPASEVGGDYYDILQHQDIIKIGMGDVTGHGLESGVLMLMVQMAVRTLLTTHLHDPIAFLDILNRALYNNIKRMNFDKNLTLCLIDYQEGRVRISGQHEEVLVVRQDGHVERIDTTPLGFFMGVKDNISNLLGYQEIILNPGDGMVLYTDGITEALNREEQQYGVEQLCTIVSQTWQGTAAQVQQAIFRDVYQHIGEQEIADDMTVLVFKRR